MEKLTSYLLPGWLRYPGILFVLIGAVLAYIRFSLGIKPDILEMQTFAVYSSYFDSKFFQIIGNNMSEEIIGILLVSGLGFLAFARDKSESDITMKLRVRALFISIYAEICFLILSLAFFYGLAFVYMLILDICFPLIIYIVVFRILLLKHKLIKDR